MSAMIKTNTKAITSLQTSVRVFLSKYRLTERRIANMNSIAKKTISAEQAPRGLNNATTRESSEQGCRCGRRHTRLLVAQTL